MKGIACKVPTYRTLPYLSQDNDIHYATRIPYPPPTSGKETKSTYPNLLPPTCLTRKHSKRSKCSKGVDRISQSALPFAEYDSARHTLDTYLHYLDIDVVRQGLDDALISSP